MTDERTTSISDLLTQAEAAHGVYEAAELGGEYDRAWPIWYARYMVDHGIGPMLGRDVTADELGALLARGYAEFEQLDPPPAGGWAAYLAERVAAEV